MPNSDLFGEKLILKRRQSSALLRVISYVCALCRTFARSLLDLLSAAVPSEMIPVRVPSCVSRQLPAPPKQWQRIRAAFTWAERRRLAGVRHSNATFARLLKGERVGLITPVIPQEKLFAAGPQTCESNSNISLNVK